MRGNGILTGLVCVAAGVACSRGTESSGAGPVASASASASASATASGPPPDSLEGRISQSLAFLAGLESLMEGYAPSLTPFPEDRTQCATSRTLKQYPTVAAARKRAENELAKVKKKRDKELSRFEKTLSPRNHGIDPGWQKRKSPIIGCVFRGALRREASRGVCDRNAFQGAAWRRFGESDDFYYSLTTTPTKPELMVRFEKEGRKLPARFYCEVEDVRVRADDRNLIWCQGAKGVSPQLRVASDGELPQLSVGDIVSVALVGTKPADPLIEKAMDGRSERRAELRWTVSANQTDLKVERTHSCALVEQAVTAAASASAAAAAIAPPQ